MHTVYSREYPMAYADEALYHARIQNNHVTRASDAFGRWPLESSNSCSEQAFSIVISSISKASAYSLQHAGKATADGEPTMLIFRRKELTRQQPTVVLLRGMFRHLLLALLSRRTVVAAGPIADMSQRARTPLKEWVSCCPTFRRVRLSPRLWRQRSGLGVWTS